MFAGKRSAVTFTHDIHTTTSEQLKPQLVICGGVGAGVQFDLYDLQHAACMHVFAEQNLYVDRLFYINKTLSMFEGQYDNSCERAVLALSLNRTLAGRPVQRRCTHKTSRPHPKVCPSLAAALGSVLGEHLSLGALETHKQTHTLNPPVSCTPAHEHSKLERRIDKVMHKNSHKLTHTHVSAHRHPDTQTRTFRHRHMHTHTLSLSLCFVLSQAHIHTHTHTQAHIYTNIHTLTRAH